MKNKPMLFRKSWVLRGLSALPVLYYFVTLACYAWNMPYMDDYPVLVEFLNRWPAANASARLDLLLEQNNFHRVVWVKMLALLNVGVTGTINFTFLQFVGNAALLLTVWLLYRASENLNRWAFLPVLFLIFQFQSWNNAFWAMAAVSNLWAPAWALLAFWLASRSFWLTFPVGLAALLTNGNGIVVLPLLCVVPVSNRQGREANKLSSSSTWPYVHATYNGTATRTTLLLTTLLALFLYFRGYNNPSGPSLVSLLSPEKIVHLLALDTAFLGAMFYHPSIAWLSQLVGGATLVWTGYLLLTRYDRKNPTLFWFLVFLHLTGLMLAVNRIEKGTELMYASRYRNITALMLATTWLTVADVARILQTRAQLVLRGLVMAGSIGIWAVSNYTYSSKIVRFRELKQTDQFLLQQFGIIRGCAPALQPAQQLMQLRQSGTFAPSPLPITELVSQPVAMNIPSIMGDSVLYKVDLNQRVGNYIVVSGWARLKGQKANFNDTFVGVQTSERLQFYTTLFHQRLDLADSVNEKDTGFTAILPAEAANRPTGIWVRSGGQMGFVRQIVVPKTLLNE